MERSQLVKGIVGSALIGAGIAVMVSAGRCVDCDKGEDALLDVASASAELADEAAGEAGEPTLQRDYAGGEDAGE